MIIRLESQVLFLGLFLALIGFNKQAFSDEIYENSVANPLVSLIQGAQKSIDIEIYTMEDATVRAELQNAITRGVQLRIIQEPSPVGIACKIFGAAASNDTSLCTDEKNFVSFVVAHGGQYVPFSKALSGNPNSNCFEHGKMVIVDQSRVLLSTGNFDPTSLCDASASPKNCDRDFSFVSEQVTVIKSLQTVFQNDLVGSTTDFSTLDSQLNVSPQSMKPITDFIASAKNSLLIENQYLQDPTMNQAILDAAHRGVQISVMVASACSFGKPKASEVTKWNNTYSAFEAAGITSKAFTAQMTINGIRGYLHAKAMIADGTRAWVGSVNGSTTALSNNREFGMFFSDPTLVSSLNQYLLADFNHPKAESWQDSLNCKNDH